MAFPGTDQDALAIVRRDKAQIAINGAYFSMDTLRPIGDIVVDGLQRNYGGMGTVLAIAEDGIAIIQRVPRSKRIDWSRYEMPSEEGGEPQVVRFTTVLGCGPALVLDGQVDVDPQAAGNEESWLCERDEPRWRCLAVHVLSRSNACTRWEETHKHPAGSAKTIAVRAVRDKEAVLPS